MIDPLTALAGIQAAVALIKKVSKTVDDVSSLGPVLGKYWDAKAVATKAAVQAKKSKSSMSVALQIELFLDEAKRFENQLELMFMQSGRVDVWNKIKARAAAMDVEAAHDARREKELASRRKKEIDEVIELALLGLVFTAMLGVITYFVFGIFEQCGGKC
jgi:Holliday junction resolvase RusA-like endonuclease